MTNWTLRCSHVALAILGLCVLPPVSAEAKDAPAVRTQQLVAALQARDAHPKAPSADGVESIDVELDGLFDFERLGADPIAPHKKAFTPAQYKIFKQTFGDLIRNKALHAGGALASGTLTIAQPVVGAKTARVEVHVTDPAKDVDSRITFVWADEGAQWRVVDVALDGSSVVKDYQNQFGHILKKDGPDVLIKKIRARLDDARKTK